MPQTSPASPVTALSALRGLPGLVLLPWRLATAAVTVTLAAGAALAPDGPIRRPGGYADQLATLLAEDGMVGRLDAMSRDRESALGRLAAVADAAAPDRPLGRAIAPGGSLDRLLAPGGVLERVLEDHGFVEKLVADGGTLDQLVALGPNLEQVHPRLIDLVSTLPELRAAIEVLSESVVPLSDLANRLPGRRRASATVS
jgi:hypothetical protein